MPIKLYNQEYEEALIASILIRPEIVSEIRPELMPEDFGGQKTQAALRACFSMYDNDNSIDMITVAQALKDTAGYGHDWTDWLAGLYESHSTAAAFKSYVNGIKEASTVRRLMNVSHYIREELEQKSQVEDVISGAKNLLIDMGEVKESRVLTAQEAVGRTLDLLERQMQMQGLTGLDTGIRLLNQKTGGLQPEDLIFIGGRPSMGKSILGTNLAESSRVPTAIFSLEMSAEMIARRQLAGSSEVPFTRLYTGRGITDIELSRVTMAADEVSKLPIFYIDTPRLNINDIVSTSENLKIKEDIGLIVVDYLQLTDGNKGANREREVADMSRSLKQLARSLGIPVVCLVQLNREVEKRQDKRPQLSDIRESGAIEQDADIVLFLYRKGIYDDTVDKGHTELLIAKGRNIGTGMIPLYLDANRMRFEDGILEDVPEY